MDEKVPQAVVPTPAPEAASVQDDKKQPAMAAPDAESTAEALEKKSVLDRACLAWALASDKSARCSIFDWLVYSLIVVLVFSGHPGGGALPAVAYTATRIISGLCGVALGAVYLKTFGLQYPFYNCPGRWIMAMAAIVTLSEIVSFMLPANDVKLFAFVTAVIAWVDASVGVIAHCRLRNRLAEEKEAAGAAFDAAKSAMGVVCP
jgi:hypothetical protein